LFVLGAGHQNIGEKEAVKLQMRERNGIFFGVSKP